MRLWGTEVYTMVVTSCRKVVWDKPDEWLGKFHFTGFIPGLNRFVDFNNEGSAGIVWKDSSFEYHKLVAVAVKHRFPFSPKIAVLGDIKPFIEWLPKKEYEAMKEYYRRVEKKNGK